MPNGRRWAKVGIDPSIYKYNTCHWVLYLALPNLHRSYCECTLSNCWNWLKQYIFVDILILALVLYTMMEIIAYQFEYWLFSLVGVKSKYSDSKLIASMKRWTLNLAGAINARCCKHRVRNSFGITLGAVNTRVWTLRCYKRHVTD